MQIHGYILLLTSLCAIREILILFYDCATRPLPEMYFGLALFLSLGTNLNLQNLQVGL